MILPLTSSDIEAWRSEHQALVRKRRQAAAASRKAKRQEEQITQEG